MGYWVKAPRANGRMIVDGPHATRQEGDDWINDHIDDPVRVEASEVIHLPTNNRAEATRMLKHRRVDEDDLEEALRNAKHPKGDEYDL